MDLERRRPDLDPAAQLRAVARLELPAVGAEVVDVELDVDDAVGFGSDGTGRLTGLQRRGLHGLQVLADPDAVAQHVLRAAGLRARRRRARSTTTATTSSTRRGDARPARSAGGGDPASCAGRAARARAHGPRRARQPGRARRRGRLAVAHRSSSGWGRRRQAIAVRALGKLDQHSELVPSSRGGHNGRTAR